MNVLASLVNIHGRRQSATDENRSRAYISQKLSIILNRRKLILCNHLTNQVSLIKWRWFVSRGQRDISSEMSIQFWSQYSGGFLCERNTLRNKYLQEWVACILVQICVETTVRLKKITFICCYIVYVEGSFCFIKNRYRSRRSHPSVSKKKKSSACFEKSASSNDIWLIRYMHVFLGDLLITSVNSRLPATPIMTFIVRQWFRFNIRLHIRSLSELFVSVLAGECPYRGSLSSFTRLYSTQRGVHSNNRPFFPNNITTYCWSFVTIIMTPSMAVNAGVD
jgi:hypothetical protein